MIVSLIVAVAEDNAIGRNNQLPWHLPEDLKFFKRTTLGKPVIMGRKTYESLGKPLPGRVNIVLTRNNNYQLPDGVVRCNELEASLTKLEEENTEETFIIGGGKIFEEAIGLADRLFITRVATTVPGADAFFPHIDHTQWKLHHEEPHTADEKHRYAYTFQVYERIAL
ncbi:MAG: dihydrofolate reductase [Taibaiella sp.]|nr:dihydrofolate reductase [Taibaiella sp.]